MQARDFFYISVGVGIWLFIFSLIFVIYQIVITLKTIRDTFESAKSKTEEFEIVTESVKVGLLALTSKILGKIIGGGENNGKKR